MKKQPIEAPPDPFGDAEAAGLITPVAKKGSSRRPGDLCKTCGTYPCPCEEFLEDYDGDVFPAKALSFADGEEWPVFLPSTRDIAAWAQKRKEGVTDLALKQRINGHKKALEAKLREKRKQDKTAKVSVGTSNSVSLAEGSSVPASEETSSQTSSSTTEGSTRSRCSTGRSVVSARQSRRDYFYGRRSLHCLCTTSCPFSSEPTRQCPVSTGERPATLRRRRKRGPWLGKLPLRNPQGTPRMGTGTFRKFCRDHPAFCRSPPLLLVLSGPRPRHPQRGPAAPLSAASSF